jgi:FlaA1/EpsC-like NDP-sugar epimerase
MSVHSIKIMPANFDNTYVLDRVVLVTGVAGTIGKALARRLIKLGARLVLGLDNDETGLSFLGTEFGDNFLPVLCDVRDAQKLATTCKGVDVVFHAAALKHVPICEQYPIEAVKTNIQGVQNIISASIRESVSRVIMMSTDKAVNPTSVMGTSKLMGEQLVKAATLEAGETIFTTTRFGNVLGSRGSVVPIFLSQIKEGGPVTVTSNEMTRFVMTLTDAIDLVLQSGSISQGGEIFVTKMAAVSVKDLAQVMIEKLAPRYGFSSTGIDVQIIGTRPGEKLYEELMTEEEVRRTTELEQYYVIMPALTDLYNNMEKTYPSQMTSGVSMPYTSHTQSLLSKNEIDEFLSTKTDLLD